MKTQATKTLISEHETAEFGGCKRKTTVHYDHLTNEEITTNLVEDKGKWVTESVSKANDVSWTATVSNTSNTGDTIGAGYGYTTNPSTTSPVMTGSLHAYGITGTDSELEKLLPLVELIGSCVACGDDVDVLFCPPCGVAIRELGRSRLQEYMREIQEELG